VGDDRLEEALALCEENGWDALPLAPESMTELFPELWGTAKAAERWLGNNPLNPVISIIRLWGLLSPIAAPAGGGAGQRRWCGTGPIRGWRSPRC
jgi:hypothetical protein